uniref:Uncharacterized protein n=1 Tax=Alexandrium andersonii TaxID=327968 RepID=A0A7S2NKS4_9DINO
MAALVCYRDQDNAERAACAVFSVTPDGKLSKGTSYAVSSSHFHSLSAAGLSAEGAVVCFRDFSQRPPQSVCKELSVSGSSLAAAQQVQVKAGRTSLARLSETIALVCSSDTHHTHQTSCAVLNTGSQAMTKGPDLVVSTMNTGSFYTAAGLSAESGLVCYEDRTYAKEHKGACVRLAIAPASA